MTGCGWTALPIPHPEPVEGWIASPPRASAGPGWRMAYALFIVMPVLVTGIHTVPLPVDRICRWSAGVDPCDEHRDDGE